VSGAATRIPPGLAQSIVIAQQRKLLDEIGVEVGTPVVYVKAAWADPVLYAGRGERVGSDVDILVRAHAFEAFAAQLARHGYTRRVYPQHLATNDAFREWAFEGPTGTMPIDLHRGLANEPWFALDPKALIDRAEAYPSTDGPILSLAPEDQVVYAATHYANSLYRIDGRHLRDTEILLGLRAVDWDAVLGRAADAYLDVALLLLLKALKSRGSAVPEPRPTPEQKLRLKWLEAFVDPAQLSRGRWRHDRLDVFVIMAAVSTRRRALPRFLFDYARLRLADRRRASV
jgi:hypothetical protein